MNLVGKGVMAQSERSREMKREMEMDCRRLSKDSGEESERERD